MMAADSLCIIVLSGVSFRRRSVCRRTCSASASAPHFTLPPAQPSHVQVSCLECARPAAVAAFAGATLTTPALAAHCPKDVKKINAALSMVKDAKMMTMAKDAANEGLALHKAKQHGEAIKVLHAAMEKNGIKH